MFYNISVSVNCTSVGKEAAPQEDHFAIINQSFETAILYDSSDRSLIQKAAGFMADDIEKVTGKRPNLVTSSKQLKKNPIIIGSLGNSSIIDGLVADGKVDVTPIENQWERFIIETIRNPFPGVKEALVVIGSDRRGAAYGVFTLSSEIGVSPWHYWADVPAKQHKTLSVKKGMYYHFDFVGGPVSYRWLNVTQIERVWEQMNLAYRWGVKDLWIVNVGDIKPMELPMSFFLDFAWDVESIKADNLPTYYQYWARQQFEDEYAEEIGEILSLYTKYNARRTPEMLKPDTYSLSNYGEADEIVARYRQLLVKSKKIYNKLPETQRAAFYQLVLSPVEICSNLNEMYVVAGKNQLYSQQGRSSTNYYAGQVKELFFRDAALAEYFHDSLAAGKWNHMMSQTHIGYTSWNNPPFNKMQLVSYIQVGDAASLGYVVQNGVESRRSKSGLFSRSFAPFDPVNNQHYFLEIFNRGKAALGYRLVAKEEWIKLSTTEGTIQFEEKIDVSIDWGKAPKGRISGEIKITSGGRSYTVEVPIRNDLPVVSGFVENQGVISIEASHFTKKLETKKISWTVVPNMGRTDSSVTVEPANADRQLPGNDTPYLEYIFTTFDEHELTVESYLSPTLNYQKNEGLQFAIAVDDEEPQIINMHEGETQPDWEYPAWWNNSVTDHIKKKRSVHGKVPGGKHTLKIWMVDPGVVFQKIVLDLGGLKPSYLGPPESVYVKPAAATN